MAKKKATKRPPASRNEATIRNVRASRKKDAALEKRIAALERRVSKLER